MSLFVHRLNIVFWSPILFLLITAGYMVASPLIAGEMLWSKIKEHW